MSGRASELTSASVRPDARDRLWSNSLVPERVKGRRRCVRRNEIECRGVGNDRVKSPAVPVGGSFPPKSSRNGG